MNLVTVMNDQYRLRYTFVGHRQAADPRQLGSEIQDSVQPM
jgi:hypothetical protein